MPRRAKDGDGEEVIEEELAPRISFRDLEKTMTPFTGDDEYGVENFITEFEDIATLMQWTEIEKFIFAKTLLAGTAKLFLRTLLSTKSWDDLKQQLTEEFGLKLSSAAIHKKLAGRKMKPNESYQQYFLHMKELAVLGNIEDESLFEYVIDGVHDLETNKFILYGATSVREFRKKLDFYAEIKKKTQNKTIMTPNSTTTGYRKKRCFNCGDLGHESPNCVKGMKCFKCNKFGHKSMECQMTTATQGAGASSKRNDGECCERQKVLNVNRNISPTVNKSVKQVRICNFTTNGLIDTGSDLNLITFDLFSKLNTKYKAEKILLTGLGSCQIYSLGQFDTDLVIDEHCYSVTFYIVPTDVMPYDVILGQPFLTNTIAVIDKGSIEIRPQYCDETYQNSISMSFSKNYANKAVQDIVHQYKPLKIKESPIKMEIVLKDDIPATERPRKLAISEEKVGKQQVDESLSKDIISQSLSKYANSLIPVKKKAKSIRVCVDYMKIDLKINVKKSQLLQSSVEYLGHIRNDMVNHSSEKTEDVMKFLQPKTLKKDTDYSIEQRTCDRMRQVKVLSRIMCFVDSGYQDRTRKAQKRDRFKIIRQFFREKYYEDDFVDILEFLGEESKEKCLQKSDELRIEVKAQILKIQDENKRTYDKKRKKSECYKEKNSKDDRGREGPIKITLSVDYMKRWP